ncbi:MAG: AAA-like domain-containing protein [Cyanobacteria bacterium P01_C01_bin.69]
MTSGDMTSEMTPYASPYQIGGSLQLDAPTYVVRRADSELYEGLKAGEFCYVLNCRQMGKSSLRVQTMARLQAEGVACVAVQMTDIIDEEITPEQFYAGVIDSIAQDLELDFDNMAWWAANEQLSLVNRFSKFLLEILLERVNGNLAIFIDEIDRVLSLPFKVNGFFAAIRECYNKRADTPVYRRLTFALLGVATPSDLIADAQSTPFNVGRAIELTGFTAQEARLLAAGLGVAKPGETLAAILRWTGGQPFLTQKVCRIVEQHSRTYSKQQNQQQTLQQNSALSAAEWVNRLVEETIIRNWQANDEPEHLRTIRDRLLKDEQRAARRLGLYQRVLVQGRLRTGGTTTEPSRDYIELRLSGVVVEQQGQLQVYNPVYAAIFDADWAAQELANLRPYSRAISAWLGSDRADKAQLLQRQELDKAKQWSEDKVLPPEDYAFLTASQELVTEEAEEAKATLALANRTLEKANQKATAKIDRANQRLRIGSLILMGTVALAVISGVTALKINALAISRETEAEQQLEDALLATQEAESKKQAAETKKEDAEKELQKATTESEEIRQRSAVKIAEANEKIEQASIQARQAQEQAVAAQTATQKAQQEQRNAQQKANAAEELTMQAQQAADKAQEEEQVATERQEIIQKGTQLELAGIAVLRRSPSQFREIDTLLNALDLGESLRNLMKRAEPIGLAQSYEDISTSPIQALRIASQSVLETVDFDGQIRGISDDGQRLVIGHDDSTLQLYNLATNQMTTFDENISDYLLSSSPSASSCGPCSPLPIRRRLDFFGNVYEVETSAPVVSTSTASQDEKRRIEYSSRDNLTRVSDRLRNEIAVLNGQFSGISNNGQQLFMYSDRDNRTQMYTLNNGNLLSRIDASRIYVSSDGRQFSIYSAADNINSFSRFYLNTNSTRLYDFLGDEQAIFSGDFTSFGHDEKRFFTDSLGHTRLYDLLGNEEALFDGTFRGFSYGGKSLIASSSDQFGNSTTRLYDLSGNEKAVFEGRVIQLSIDGQ